MQYWIVVVSKDHVRKALKGGFCQACHGKKWPLEKMQAGDRVLFYSSKLKYGSSESYQKFTAIGMVKKGDPYQDTVDSDFSPYRKDIAFMECRESRIHPILTQLHFSQHAKNWGYKLMSGFLEIDKHDFELISKTML